MISYYLQMSHRNFLSFVMLVLIGWTVITAGRASFFGFHRIKRTLKLISSVQKINYEVNGIHTYRNYKVSKAMILCLMSLCIFVVFLKIETYNSKGYLACFYKVNEFEAIKLALLHMEYLFVKLEIFQLTKALNKKLRQIVDDLKSGSMTAYAIRSNSTSVRELMKFYVTICELVETINRDSGLDMFMLFGCSNIALLITLFKFITLTRASSKPSGSEIFEQIFWFVCNLITEIISVEPSHLINEEIVETRNQVTHLMYETTPVGKPILLELDLMFKQLILIEPQIAPLQIYTVQRSIYTKALTFITTYLVIIIQSAKTE